MKFRWKFPDDWDPKKDMEVDQVVYSKYKAQLYGVLVSLTTEEPLRIMRGLQDTMVKYDVYKAIVALSQ
eukprot:4122711-Karenia_brevis.AAC.1